MESLSKQDRERALWAVAVWCLHQGKGIKPDEVTLEKLGFGSVEAMQIQLGNWGIPDWIISSQREVEPKAPKSASPERKARARGGEAEELPAAADASRLFQGAIDCLKTDLDYANHLHEVLQDGCFEATFLYPKEEERFPHLYFREEVSPGRWEELCAEHGEDPASTEALCVPMDRRMLGGVSPYPSMHLVRLIAAYLITASTWRGVETLLERLHPKSREPNKEQIRKYLTSNEGLLPTIKN